jgi:4-deoxy-L-threo-5-hexosulose-uronate ketol-isomerase
MESRFHHSPNEVKQMNTAQLREHFLIQKLMVPGELKLVYSHYDRVIIGGAVPTGSTIELSNPGELRAEYFLQRREMGVINVGGKGSISTDGATYEIDRLGALYIGLGTKAVSFQSADAANPAIFYILSAPAHKEYPITAYTKEDALPVQLGEQATANKRTIFKYIHAQGIQSCQLVMGLTLLDEGSIWNTMPSHTHTRRMEAYFYFDVQESHRVIHLMGEPTETRHLIVANNEAIISPPWSIHSGCGTANYGFIWGMAGENYDYTDMDPAPVSAMM